MCAQMARLTVSNWLVLLQVHHAADVAVAVSQTVR